MKPCRCLFALLFALMLCIGPEAGAKKNNGSTTRTSSAVTKEKKSVQKEVDKTRREIEANKKRTADELDRLESIRADINRNHVSIEQYQQSIDSLDKQMVEVTASISELNAELKELQEGYARELRRIQPTLRPMNRLAFIFAGKSIGEIYRRMRYAGEINRWRRERLQRIAKVTSELHAQRNHLAGIDAQRRGALNELHKTRNILDASEMQTRNIVADLQKNNKQLHQTLAERQQRSKNLDNELNRIIAEEQRQAAEAKKRKLEEERKQKAAEAEKKRKEAEAEKRRKAEEERRNREAIAKNTPVPSKQPVTPAPKQEQPKPTPPAPQKETAAVTTGSFESAKGKLMPPVSGSYSVLKKFGRQPHPDIPNVSIDNPGVDFVTSSGASARAVFAGTVSAVFKQDGYNTIVMVRHGDYLTIYGGLDGINVKRGDVVKAGQNLGRVVTDGNGRSVLHFEVRRERTKLNPLSWIK